MKNKTYHMQDVSSSDEASAYVLHADMPPVQVRGVSFSYSDKDVLNDISFDVPFGHTTMLIGDNGAGKSTLIKLILGELKPSAGRISVFGVDPLSFSDWDKIGYVPQFESQGIQGFPATALEIVESGLTKRQRKTLKTRTQKRECCLEALALCHVSDLGNKLISTLSGGQRQRVMLARALVKDPDLLVLDEPTSSLDIKASKQFFSLLEKLCHNNLLAALVVTHDQAQLECKHAQVVSLREGKSYLITSKTQEVGDLC